MTEAANPKLRIAGLAATAAVAIAIFYVLFRLAGGDPPLRDAYELQAVVPSAVALSPNADVRAAGVRIGEVGEIAHRGGNAVLRVKLDPKYAPVYRDASVLVRLKTLVGENYLQLDPGTPKAGELPSGGVLTIEHADEATQLDEILSVLDAPSRRHVQRILDATGGGLRDRGEHFNDMLAESTALVRHGGPAVAVLREQRDEIARFVDDFGRTARAIGDRGEDLRTLARGARTAAEAAASRDELLAEGLSELPATLAALRGVSNRLGAFSRDGTPVLRDLTTGIDELAPAFRVMGPASAEARAMLRQLDAFAPAVEPLLDRVAPFSDAAVAAMPPLRDLLEHANPLAKYLAPYARESAVFFANTASATNARDAIGNLARIHPVASESFAPNLPPDLDDAYRALVGTGVLSEVRRPGRGTNAYPAPGKIGNPEPFAGDYPRLTPNLRP